MKCSGIDLHIHSTASDGTNSPSEILQLATQLNLGAIAITDHDTLKGVKQALSCGIPRSLKFLTGVEISSNPPPSFSAPGSLHILGYGIKTDDKQMNDMLGKLQDARINRNPKIITRLNQTGLDISLSEVMEKAGTGQPGRPHIAMLMVEKGMVKSVNEAFDLFLGKGKPAYVDKPRIESSEAIRTIINAGGIPVLAHPGLVKSDSGDSIERLIDTLMGMGLKGVEAYYPGHTSDQTAKYHELAKKNNLLITGGS
ncbi:MAG: PHP domain-containing protein, partial [Deltaproteobacteria bacterium]|nr:PHP domain-containing protein [Deltaproteobacteria bacterium]